MSRGPVHEFRCRLSWTGGDEGPTRSYRAYSRRYRVDFVGKPSLEGSAAPPFLGEDSRHNPEDLMMAALSACHCLSYLALCAQRSIAIAKYEDDAWGQLALVEGGLQFVEVVLRPRVAVEARSAERLERARVLHADAHKQCFIARSVNF
ncbi:MAG: OsmC family protein, partial [Myxococcota bacterium]